MVGTIDPSFNSIEGCFVDYAAGNTCRVSSSSLAFPQAASLPTGLQILTPLDSNRTARKENEKGYGNDTRKQGIEIDKRTTLGDKKWLMSAPPRVFWRVHISQPPVPYQTCKDGSPGNEERETEVYAAECMWDPNTTLSDTEGFIAKEHYNYRLSQILSKENVQNHLYSTSSSSSSSGLKRPTGLISVFDSCENAMAPLPPLTPQQTGIHIVQIATRNLKPGFIRLRIRRCKRRIEPSRLFQTQLQWQKDVQMHLQSLKLSMGFGSDSRPWTTGVSRSSYHRQRLPSADRRSTTVFHQMSHQQDTLPTPTSTSNSNSNSKDIIRPLSSRMIRAKPNGQHDDDDDCGHNLVKVRVLRNDTNIAVADTSMESTTTPILLVSASELFSIYDYDFPRFFNKGEWFAVDAIPAHMFEQIYSY